MGESPSFEWVSVPQGRYSIGLDDSEARQVSLRLFSSASIPVGTVHPSLISAKPAIVVDISPFEITRTLVLQEMSSIEFAIGYASSLGLSLPTEYEWEVAERYGSEKISTPGFEEWCLDLFSNRRLSGDIPPNPVVVGYRRGLGPEGAPKGRNVIRGYGLPKYHPSMRFHGGIGNRPFKNTGFRLVRRRHELNRCIV